MVLPSRRLEIAGEVRVAADRFLEERLIGEQHVAQQLFRRIHDCAARLLRQIGKRGRAGPPADRDPRFVTKPHDQVGHACLVFELRKAAMERDRLWPEVETIIHRDGRTLKGYDSYRNGWARALNRAGLRNVLLYDMRRTAASNLLSAGIDPATVCLIVGWRSMQTMMRYVQLPDSRLKTAG